MSRSNIGGPRPFQAKEQILAAVPALSDVVDLAGHNDPCDSWHTEFLAGNCVECQDRKQLTSPYP
jgi:hypothetical protein